MRPVTAAKIVVTVTSRDTSAASPSPPHSIAARLRSTRPRFGMPRELPTTPSSSRFPLAGHAPPAAATGRQPPGSTLAAPSASPHRRQTPGPPHHRVVASACRRLRQRSVPATRLPSHRRDHHLLRQPPRIRLQHNVPLSSFRLSASPALPHTSIPAAGVRE